MNKHDSIVIIGATRTPMGSFQGDLKNISGQQLGSHAIKGALEHAKISPERVEEVLMGCVLSAGMGQAPARQASLGAGIPCSVGCTTINKMCGSGMKTVMLAHDLLKAGNNDMIVAGGMESMTNAPYLIQKARAGLRMGHNDIKDHMFLDGLEDAYDEGRLMGAFAEETAERYKFSREQQDEFAIESLIRAKRANEDGTFDNEITAVTYTSRKGEVAVNRDEQPFRADLKKITTLKPAFQKDGTVTAANSSSISDGAAALILTTLSYAQKNGLEPLAKIINHTSYAHEPSWFTTAPVHAVKDLMDKVSWTKSEVDLFEINEAFAVVTLVAIHDLELSHDSVNIHGGACALGHPLGASGARILVTLLNALQKYDLKRGIAALCIGGGEATAVAVERM